jgi:hypothetical protein
MRVIEEKEVGNRKLKSAIDVKETLQGRITKATKLVDAILETFSEDETCAVLKPNPDVFCLLSACMVYISFAISSFTKPRDDFFFNNIVTVSNTRPKSLSWLFYR